eukprot:04095_2
MTCICFKNIKTFKTDDIECALFTVGFRVGKLDLVFAFSNFVSVREAFRNTHHTHCVFLCL